MSKNLLKDTLRTIRKTFAKFVTLFAIVALGVAFFVGVSAAAPIMSVSVDKYNDENSFMDLQIYSTFGFEEGDIEALETVDGIEEVVGTKFVDVIGKYENKLWVIRVESYQPNQNLNNFVLKEGRMPKNKNECLAEKGGSLRTGVPLGAVIDVTRPENDTDDYLDVNQLTVVGLVDTPEYVNEEKGNSTLSNQAIQTFLFVPEESFSTDYYSSIIITVDGAKELNGFSQAYTDFIDPVQERIETLATTQSQVRRDRIYQEAMEEYNDGLQEYEDGKKEFNDEIAKAQREINDAKQKLVDGEQEIKDNEEKLETESAKALLDLDNAQKDLEKGLVEWKAQKAKFDEETKPALLSQKNSILVQVGVSSLDQLNGLITQVQGNVTNLQTKINDKNTRLQEIEVLLNTTTDPTEIATLNAEKQAINAELQTLQTNLATATATLVPLTQARDGINQIDAGIASGEAQLTSAKQLLDEGAGKVWAGRLELEETKKDALQKIADAKVELADGKVELADAEKKFAEEKEKGQKELDDGWADLVKAKEDISKIEKAEWTVLDRDMNYSSKTFKDTIAQMRSIAAVFPVFFFLVAALVCLTTMTRMVDEQRGQIGVLRALGYGKLACASKYLIYAILATLLGGFVGTIFGLLIFPGVVYTAWGMMYVLPPIQLFVPWDLVILSNGLFVSVMALTTWFAARQSMNEVPSQLLRPKSPPMGKKIILERLPLIWNRFSFTSKVTARNIIRYKKRFLMTVIGIAGCTALLVAGFGIKDSISTIVDKQFNQIYQYDGQVALDDDLVQSKINEVQTEINNLEGVTNSLQLTSYQAKTMVNNDEQVATVYVYKNDEELKSMNDIRHRKDSKEIILDDSGVIIDEKLAELLNLSVGDTISIESENEIIKDFVVSDINEMYVNHSVFMTPTAYENAFGIKPTTNILQVVLDYETSDFLQKVSYIDGVQSVSFYGSLIENFNNMINGLNVVVVVLIVCAGLLAFVVLSNLTNVNISERQREIATLKVLGFNRKEVNMYIYKENLILTFIGSIFGLGLGVVLHKFIILMVEMDYIMFGRDVSVFSLILSVLITMFFALVVNFFMTFKLRKIQMVESLKSVE
ncbi:FtsX-like permease family protein [Anaerorhabdus furcosa]|uniref:Putative ABC transport system permease protein n=1 Tax=Anaerorhabdus furcosa TaxID=118967 RepID=A0A1T4P5R3_9FIRM|nr:FtsX-like permease family protein [Anaerorhabdus furcosa]SJZ86853.1 putative ABC transport system permease protein [Anaerorhabdus furcosa]